ncbi:helix-turn-helix domain-containing protein [Phyllobacterium sp. P5_D12]
MDNTYKALDDLIAPSVEDIIRVVAESNRLSSADLIDRSRKPYIVDARDDAIAEAWVRLRDWSLTDIGIAFGNRNYAAVKKSLLRRDIDVSGIIDREAVIADAKTGLTTAELTFKHHCSRPSVRKILYEAKVSFKA